MPPTISSIWTQCFPPAPSFTEKDVPDLAGKVYIVTGSTGGIGKELVRLLYSRNARVYLAGRHEQDAIPDIRQTEAISSGSLVLLKLDLADLGQVKSAAERFIQAETRLDVLFNNAGCMTANDPLRMDRKAQGYEKQLGVNCLGPFLFTKLLTPLLLATAEATESTDRVRVVFAASLAAEMYHDKHLGIDMDNLDYHKPKPAMDRYATSKVGTWAQGVEFTQRFGDRGVVGVAANPGNLRSNLFHEQGILARLQVWLIHYPPVRGAYTELYAGLSPDVGASTGYVVPFGRLQPICKDLEQAAKPASEGGSDVARRFWDWCEKQTESFV